MCIRDRSNPQDFLVPANIFSDVKHVIGVVSGKGGVGKSFVTGSLANAMAAKGYKVGILDADITGPSIPKMYGVHGPAQADDEGIYPMITENDIKIMSINLLMPDEEAPVIWRGPVISNMVKQFFTDVIWGEIDYLLVDMPPGTGDVPLTVFQSLPLDGIVIVSSPQDLVRLIVKKAYNMAKTMDVKVLGIIENYSFVKCPDCQRAVSYTHLDLKGKKVLVTAGPTVEAIDPVRYITNHSTGKMGYAIARNCMMRGADVTLVTGPVSIPKPYFVNVVEIQSAREMFEAVKACADEQDIIIKSAAVADYRPKYISDEKIKKSGSSMALELEKTDDILKYLGEHKKKGQFLCGFSMETENMIQNSREKLKKKNVDMIAANNLKQAGAGFGTDTNVITLILSLIHI